MSRIEPSGPRGLMARVIFFFAKRAVGKVPTPLRVAAHSKSIVRGVAEMERFQVNARALDPALKSLVGIRVATRVGCPF